MVRVKSIYTTNNLKIKNLDNGFEYKAIIPVLFSNANYLTYSRYACYGDLSFENVYYQLNYSSNNYPYTYRYYKKDGNRLIDKNYYSNNKLGLSVLNFEDYDTYEQNNTKFNSQNIFFYFAGKLKGDTKLKPVMAEDNYIIFFDLIASKKYENYFEDGTVFDVEPKSIKISVKYKNGTIGLYKDNQLFDTNIKIKLIKKIDTDGVEFVQTMKSNKKILDVIENILSRYSLSVNDNMVQIENKKLKLNDELKNFMKNSGKVKFIKVKCEDVKEEKILNDYGKRLAEEESQRIRNKMSSDIVTGLVTGLIYVLSQHSIVDDCEECWEKTGRYLALFSVDIWDKNFDKKEYSIVKTISKTEALNFTKNELYDIEGKIYNIEYSSPDENDGNFKLTDIYLK